MVSTRRSPAPARRERYGPGRVRACGARPGEVPMGRQDEPGPPPAPAASEPGPALHGARLRRLALGEAMGRTEQALALPSASPSWRHDVADALQHVRIALAEHVDEVEGAEGLLVELRQADPRLISKVEQLEREHPQLAEAVDAALRSVEQHTVEEARSTVLDLLLALSRHRQRGADLVYEAYSVDIGAQ